MTGGSEVLRSVRHRLSKIKEWVETREPKPIIIPFSAPFESKVAPSALAPVLCSSILQFIELDDDARKKYTEELGATTFAS